MTKAVIVLFVIGVCMAAPAPQELSEPNSTLSPVASSTLLIQSNPVSIVSQETDLYPDGHYSYSFESANGIKQEQTGSLKLVNDVSVLSVKGQYSYKDDEGKEHLVTYIADENGYQPLGDDVPLIPEAIAKALKTVAENPQEQKEKEIENPPE